MLARSRRVNAGKGTTGFVDRVASKKAGSGKEEATCLRESARACLFLVVRFNNEDRVAGGGAGISKDEDGENYNTLCSVDEAVIVSGGKAWVVVRCLTDSEEAGRGTARGTSTAGKVGGADGEIVVEYNWSTADNDVLAVAIVS